MAAADTSEGRGPLHCLHEAASDSTRTETPATWLNDAKDDSPRRTSGDVMESASTNDHDTGVLKDVAYSENIAREKNVQLEINGRNQTVPNLELGEATNPTESDSTSSRRKSHGTDNNSERNSKVETKPVRKCEHMIMKHGPLKDSKLKKKFKLPQDEECCIICELSDATARYASDDANRMLMEIVYPHEFYDKFQRSGKTIKEQQNSRKKQSVSKETVNFCRPAKMSPKLGRREHTSFIPATDRSDVPVNTVRYSYRKWTSTDRLESDTLPEKRMRPDQNAKHIHTQCRARENALVMTDDSEGQKLVLKGLRGWLVRRDEAIKAREAVQNFKGIKKGKIQ